jgi:hypothetical protein
VTDSEFYEGTFAAVSGHIDDEETSVLFLDMEVLNDDSISFYRKVSCEDDPYQDDYDFLAFFIDNTEMDRWDGEVEWSRVSYPVTQGTHTFKWVYSKDYSVSSGYDAAWIDYIIFPGATQSVSVYEFASIKNASMMVYPNPASKQASIYLKLQESVQVSIRVLDLTGRTILEPVGSQVLPAGNHNLNLDLEGLPAGAYLIVLESSQGSLTKKLIRK